jgi:hypothetical protein
VRTIDAVVTIALALFAMLVVGIVFAYPVGIVAAIAALVAYALWDVHGSNKGAERTGAADRRVGRCGSLTRARQQGRPS